MARGDSLTFFLLGIHSEVRQSALTLSRANTNGLASLPLAREGKVFPYTRCWDQANACSAMEMYKIYLSRH